MMIHSAEYSAAVDHAHESEELHLSRNPDRADIIDSLKFSQGAQQQQWRETQDGSSETKGDTEGDLALTSRSLLEDTVR